MIVMIFIEKNLEKSKPRGLPYTRNFLRHFIFTNFVIFA